MSFQIGDYVIFNQNGVFAYDEPPYHGVIIGKDGASYRFQCLDQDAKFYNGLAEWNGVDRSFATSPTWLCMDEYYVEDDDIDVTDVMEVL